MGTDVMPTCTYIKTDFMSEFVTCSSTKERSSKINKNLLMSPCSHSKKEQQARREMHLREGETLKTSHFMTGSGLKFTSLLFMV
jgi:hypothetical protein